MNQTDGDPTIQPKPRLPALEQIAVLTQARNRAKSLLELLLAQERELSANSPSEMHSLALAEGKGAFRKAVMAASKMLDDLEQALGAMDSNGHSDDHNRPIA